MATYKIRPVAVGALSRGAGYTVKDLGGSPQGYTNMLDKELGVSLDSTAGGTRWTQLHELAHVRYSLWSPSRVAKYMQKTNPKIEVSDVLAAEDARINERLIRNVPDAHEGFRYDGSPLREDISGYIASHASPKKYADTIRRSCDPEQVSAVDSFLAKVRAMPTSALTLHNVTMPLASLLRALQDGEKAPEDKGGESKGDGKGKGGDKGDKGEPSKGEPDESGDESEGKDSNVEDAKDRKALGEPDHSPITCKGGDIGKPPDSVNQWVIPEVIEPELGVTAAPSNARVTTAETGNCLRWGHLYRARTDGMVFRRNARKPGALQRGTVLIDGSGSMLFDNETLDAMVKLLPHATIAIYGGYAYTPAATIVILGRNGKRVKTIRDDFRRFGNTCDGPALLWLSRQQGPRLWVCDGDVTGIEDRRGVNLAPECDAIMRAASIIQLSGRAALTPTRTLRHAGTQIDNIETLKVALKAIERGNF